jgi:hypothetical protein
MNFLRLKDISLALYDKDKDGRNNHFAFVLNKSKLLSIGINQYNKTHPRVLDYDYKSHSGLHAELSACLKLGLTNCSNLTIVSTRVNRNSKLDNAKPCFGCADLIRKLNFKSCYFTDENGQFQVFEL